MTVAIDYSVPQMTLVRHPRRLKKTRRVRPRIATQFFGMCR